MRILQVLTLIGSNGEYGGPSQVCLDQTRALSKFGHKVEILAGITEAHAGKRNEDLNLNLIRSRSLVKKFSISSLWSWQYLKIANSKIKTSDIVHIHFARDLFPIVTALVCLVRKKALFLQTHGMIKKDEKLIPFLLDHLLVIHILKRARACFVLTETEKAQVLSLSGKINCKIIPNGISNQELKTHQSDFSRIIFCSRLHKRKQVNLFLDLAIQRLRLGNNEIFQIYGPDFGDLPLVQNVIKKQKYKDKIQYGGALPQDKVIAKLRETDLLVLPSKNEPYPLIVIQAIAVGTPVLVMPSCGLSKIFLSSFPEFVAEEENISGLLKNFEIIREKSVNAEYAKSIAKFSREMFSIDKVAEGLNQHYKALAKNEY